MTSGNWRASTSRWIHSLLVEIIATAVLEAADIVEANALANANPGIKSGHFLVELYPVFILGTESEWSISSLVAQSLNWFHLGCPSRWDIGGKGGHADQEESSGKVDHRIGRARCQQLAAASHRGARKGDR